MRSWIGASVFNSRWGLSTTIVPAILLVSSLAQVNSSLGITHLRVGETLPATKMLTPGTRRYVRYTVQPDGRRTAIDIWTRQISFETRDGHNIVRLHQEWDEVAPAAVVIQDSYFQPGTLRPIEHVRSVMHDGKTSIGGYRFLPDKIVGMDEIPDNSRKGFNQPETEAVYNWEADTELLQSLPLAANSSFNIPFYDPGQEPPGRYTYAVVGSEQISITDTAKIDCWIVQIDFKKDHATRRFWFSKAEHTLIHEETRHGDGSIEVKSQLNPES